MTFESRAFSTIRKPARKTVAATSTYTGQTGEAEPGARPRAPIQTMRPSRYWPHLVSVNQRARRFEKSL